MEEKLKPASYYQEGVSGVEAGLPSRNPKRSGFRAGVKKGRTTGISCAFYKG